MKKIMLLMVFTLLLATSVSAYTTQVAATLTSLSGVSQLDNTGGEKITVTILNAAGDTELASDYAGGGVYEQGATILSPSVDLEYSTAYKFRLETPQGDFTFEFTTPADPGGVDTSSGTAVADQILSGEVAWVDSTEITGTMANIGQQTITPTTSNQVITAGYHDGSGYCVGDADLVASNILSGVNIFGVDGSASAGGGAELHSGQTTSYDTGTLDDAEQDGTAKSYTDNGDGTVTDDHTGLVWQKSDHGPPLNWEDALTYCSNLADGVDGLTDGSSTGDWRLPGFVEGATLIDHSYPGGSYKNPALTWSGDNYWTSTTFLFNTDDAYYLHFDYGSVYNNGKVDEVSVCAKCVRDQ